MIPPGQYDIVMQKGATFAFSISASDKDGSVNFSSIYHKASMSIYRGYYENDQSLPEPVHELTTENGEVVIDGLNVHFGISAAITKSFNFTDGFYIIKLIINTSDPTIDVILKGRFIVETK